MLTDDSPTAAVTDALVELIRQEVPALMRSGKNWKLVINASAAGDISTAVEMHCQRVRRFQVVGKTE